MSVVVVDVITIGVLALVFIIGLFLLLNLRGSARAAASAFDPAGPFASPWYAHPKYYQAFGAAMILGSSIGLFAFVRYGT